MQTAASAIDGASSAIEGFQRARNVKSEVSRALDTESS